MNNKNNPLEENVLDPMLVDKKEKDMDELYAEGHLAHSSAEDSRINDLDSITIEDHQQIYGNQNITEKSDEGALN